jgi:DNA-binding beta-propeller fold protein YncE
VEIGKVRPVKNPIRRRLGLLAWSALTLFCVVRGHAASTYYPLQEIPIGGAVGTPSLAIDLSGRRLYVTHSTKIEIVDLDSNQAVGTISNTPSVRDFALAPELGRGFASNYRDGIVSVIDLKSGFTTTKLETSPGVGPLATILETIGKAQLFVFNTRTLSATVFNAATVDKLAVLPLPGKPQVAAADLSTGRVYCALYDRNEVVALDAKGLKISGTWPIAPGKEPAGLAVDSAPHRLFVGCRNKFLVMLDTLTGKVTASVPIGTGVDAIAFDPATELVFCANSDGTVTIAHEDAPDKLSVVQTLQTERNARIMALDPKTHRIYLANTDVEAQSEPDPGAPPARPRTLANTLKILVYGPVQP